MPGDLVLCLLLVREDVGVQTTAWNSIAWPQRGGDSRSGQVQAERRQGFHACDGVIFRSNPKMHLDRRAFLGLTGAATASSLFLFGRSGGAAQAVHFSVNHTPAEWRKILGNQRYAVLREGATERPFSSPLLNEHRRGTFVCAACALPLFSSATKYDSG